MRETSPPDPERRPERGLTAEALPGEGRVVKEGPSRERLAALAGNSPLLRIDGLVAGYGKMEVLHGIDLHVGAGQALCLIGPNGAGKSTVLHSIYGFTTIMGGSITADGRDITRVGSNEKLKTAGIAYVLQHNSVFPDMTLEENLWMGGFLMESPRQAKAAAETVFAKYPLLKERRRQRAGTLSGGERRILEIARSLVMEPRILLVDEPSIGLEPRYIGMVFEVLEDLKRQGKTIVMVEQNAKKGLQFSDIGYVLVSGEIAMAGTGKDLLRNPEVGRLFLGG
ncbi:MAG TPA: ABC transporter ATP-binding protein [Candidatus Methylomirabilis sp.]|nr:ABC transporter ATP-binding protein [Candidatus Methylomirabilis sp.]